MTIMDAKHLVSSDTSYDRYQMDDISKVADVIGFFDELISKGCTLSEFLIEYDTDHSNSRPSDSFKSYEEFKMGIGVGAIDMEISAIIGYGVGPNGLRFDAKIKPMDKYILITSEKKNTLNETISNGKSL